MRRTEPQLARYLAALAAYLRNHGADVPEPRVHEYTTGNLGFDATASLPGTDEPTPAVVRLAEKWSPVGSLYERVGYAYELTDYPRNRRRAFHRHDVARWLAELGVAVHEHCEDELGRPTCAHYLGLPVEDGFEGLDRLLEAWTSPGQLGCGDLRCAEPR